ncbi:hypothetical protein NQ314_010076 [Rhamnusium bicolor]|uniref:Uncharacterized protein n=1 Tax=Rhamnusium bicolor TaxID=1586634 RepID=A0AAV8XVV6_9CUCU|nr:hypothetical protein NQ314_010076 [Rhamnusium bicolor]
MFFMKKQIVISECFNGKEGVGGRPKFTDTLSTWILRILEMLLQVMRVMIKVSKVPLVQDLEVETLTWGLVEVDLGHHLHQADISLVFSQCHPQSPDSEPQSPQNCINLRSVVNSALSRSSSSDYSHPRSRPHTPKSPESISYRKSQTHSPSSPSGQPRSRFRSVSPLGNNVQINTPRSTSPHNSTCYSSPDSLIKGITKSSISDDDNISVKSGSTRGSKKSRSSRCSGRSSSTRDSRRTRLKSDNENSSDSSESSVDSSSQL